MSSISELMHGLAQRLDGSPRRLLSMYIVEERLPGIYQLFYSNQLVYVGKTNVSLRQRLAIHYRKINTAPRIDVASVSYQAVTDNEYLVMATEQWMIDSMKPAWNFSGFGSNPHGKGRPNQKLSEWLQTFG